LKTAAAAAAAVAAAATATATPAQGPGFVLVLYSVLPSTLRCIVLYSSLLQYSEHSPAIVPCLAPSYCCCCCCCSGARADCLPLLPADVSGPQPAEPTC
jgi:hypothetical protein